MDYKWKALSVTSIGVAMSAVDSTIVILALFPIATSLKSNFVTIVWVIIAYILMSTALVLNYYDRICMVFANVESIKEVILFPQMKRKAD